MALQKTVLTSHFYGPEVFYGPKTPAWVINQVQVGFNQVSRAILPVYKSTPTIALLLNKDDSASAAYCIFRRPSTELTHGFVSLGKTVEIYDAEIHGALEGLRAALDHLMAKFTTDLIVYLDNEEAALRLNTGVPTTINSGQIAEFQIQNHGITKFAYQHVVEWREPTENLSFIS
ncbi:hypothetical protein EPUL_002015, partial [Erysiphe pulchra]